MLTPDDWKIADGQITLLVLAFSLIVANLVMFVFSFKRDNKGFNSLWSKLALVTALVLALFQGWTTCLAVFFLYVAITKRRPN